MFFVNIYVINIVYYINNTLLRGIILEFWESVINTVTAFSPDKELRLIGAIIILIIADVSVMPARRIYIKFSAAYNSDIDKIKNILLNTASEQLLVFKDPMPVAYPAEHGDSTLCFLLRVWCNNTNYWTVYYNLIKNVKKGFDKNCIEIPFLQLDIHLDKNI